MRTRRNITIAIPEDLYRRTKIYLARRNMSMSRAVSFLLQHMPDVDRAVRQIIEEEDHREALARSSEASPHCARLNESQISGCETVKPCVSN